MSAPTRRISPISENVAEKTQKGGDARFLWLRGAL
jgi:hypothetical protein